MRIALYGGSFDPVHHGHLIIARAVAERLDCARVVLLPSRIPPHKQGVKLASAEHRVAMLERAVAGDALFEVSDHDLTCEGPSYTAHTVAHFRGELADDDALFWIIGGDSLLELHTWYQPEVIVEHCHVVTAVRPGYEVTALPELEELLSADQVARLRADILETPRIDISATDIRKRVSAGQSVRYLVPQSVADYIRDHRLYA